MNWIGIFSQTNSVFSAVMDRLFITRSMMGLRKRSAEKPTAIGSCNYHMDHFGAAFGIRTAFDRSIGRNRVRPGVAFVRVFEGDGDHRLARIERVDLQGVGYRYPGGAEALRGVAALQRRHQAPSAPPLGARHDAAP